MGDGFYQAHQPCEILKSPIHHHHYRLPYQMVRGNTNSGLQHQNSCKVHLQEHHIQVWVSQEIDNRSESALDEKYNSGSDARFYGAAPH
uniref:Uncharacterized protein n=2 Tax=Picea TaxID=3328 RepID=A0A101LY42_PICGL|nr:hypothetical protein ABT39_MTgene5656 [Picea glauca]QHR90263.1 hypothetical protein Q903MT_gene4286 [Picea sitchensis]